MSRQHDQLERLTFFSDAVFAIAMTLLVVEVRLPHGVAATDAALGQALLDLIPAYVAFLVSFLVLARFWAGHHTLMGLLATSNPRLLWANLALLLAVAFMPFPTAVVSQYAPLRVGIGVYAGGCCCSASSTAALRASSPGIPSWLPTMCRPARSASTSRAAGSRS